MSSSSTALLHRLAEHGDGEAWSALIERHLPDMRRAAVAAAGPEMADDALQEAALQIRDHAGLFHPPAGDDGERAASAWTRTIAAHCALMLRRSSCRRAHHEARQRAQPLDPAASAPDIVIADEERHLLRAAIAELPEHQRRPILLRYCLGMASKDQLGTALGCHPDAAGMRVHRALKRLRARLQRAGLVVSLALLSRRLEGAAADVRPGLIGQDVAPSTDRCPLLDLSRRTCLRPADVIPSPRTNPMRLALASSVASLLVLVTGMALHAQDGDVANPAAAAAEVPPQHAAESAAATASHAADHAASDPTSTDPADQRSVDVQRVVAGMDGFAAQLYGQIAARPGNIGLSPYSIASALSLLMAGATGATHDGLWRMLGYQGGEAGIHAALAELTRMLQPRGAGEYELATANALWLQQGWRPRDAFATIMRTDYDGQLMAVDFSGHAADAMQAMNAWVEQRTRGRITHLIQSLSDTTRLGLTNALWLKAPWSTFFDKARTADGSFTTPSGSISVPLMHQAGYAEYLRVPGGTVASRACRGGLTFVVVVPDDPQGLPKLEAQVVAGALPGWLHASAVSQVAWTLPKMKLEQQDPLELVPALTALGMKDGRPEGFSQLATPAPDDLQPLVVGQVVHKVFLSVEETGLEAAGATAIVMLGGLPPSERTALPVTCDRPFLWAIWHERTRLLLFIGRVTDPSKGL